MIVKEPDIFMKQLKKIFNKVKRSYQGKGSSRIDKKVIK